MDERQDGAPPAHPQAEGLETMSQTMTLALQTFELGDFEAAAVLMRRAITAEKIRSQDIHALLGDTLARLGEPLQAAEAYAEAARLSGPGTDALLRNALDLFQAAGNDAAIADLADFAFERFPADPGIATICIGALIATGRAGDALAHLDRLDRKDRAQTDLLLAALRATGHHPRLLAELDAACQRFPGDAGLRMARLAAGRRVCDLANAAAFEAEIADPDAPGVDRLLSEETAAERLLRSDDEAMQARPNADSLRLAAVPAAPARRAFSAPGGKIRIGYLSNDFYDHATMRLFAPVLTMHDRAQFDVTLFCYTDPALRGWQETGFPAFVRRAIVRVDEIDDAGAAEAIAARGIDILVDLKGFAAGDARPGIVKRADAPVKAAYLGFAGSIHGADLDYAITDRFVTPDAAKPFYAEKLCRLPETYQPNDSESRPLPRAARRADWDLPETGFVFASFNSAQKITGRTVDLWSRILAKAPEAVLWMLCEEPLARRNLLDAFAARGIAASRILFTGHVDYADHLARLSLADLGLDTMPHNGHTTTSDMIWAGLPVLTVRGGSFAARVSESLLNAIGLGELTAANDTAFCDMAAAMARAPRKIAELKERLEENRFSAPLFNGKRITAHLERAYQMMAERARAGLSPCHLDVPALPALEHPFASWRRGG